MSRCPDKEKAETLRLASIKLPIALKEFGGDTEIRPGFNVTAVIVAH